MIAWAELIGLFLFLSAFDAVTRSALVAGLVLVFVAALATVFILGVSKRLPSLPRRAFSDTDERRPLVLLTVVVSVGLAYIIALIVGTPPNGWDPTNYHLARAAFWLQSGGVGYIKDAYDQRLNFNPPNGEIGFAFVLGVTREENLVGFVQFFAALACANGVFAVARRIGLGRAEAAFGALVFLICPSSRCSLRARKTISSWRPSSLPQCYSYWVTRERRLRSARLHVLSRSAPSSPPHMAS